MNQYEQDMLVNAMKKVGEIYSREAIILGWWLRGFEFPSSKNKYLEKRKVASARLRSLLRIVENEVFDV